MIWAGINREMRISSEKGIGWALWLYGFARRLKYIFILTKLRLIQIIQRKKKHFVQINFVGENYFFSTASGNSLRISYKAIAEVTILHCFVAFLHFVMLTRAVIFHFAKKVEGEK